MICECCKGTAKHNDFGGNHTPVACGECYGTGHVPTRFERYIAAADGVVYTEGPVPWKDMRDFLEMIPRMALDKPVGGR